MDIPQHIMSGIPGNPLNALTDDGRTQVSYMERLCHIRAAVIHYNFAGILRHIHAEFLPGPHPVQVFSHKPFLHL